MANVTELQFKLSIDGKEALAVIQVTDENLNDLYSGFKYGKQQGEELTTSLSQGLNNAREMILGAKEMLSVFVGAFEPLIDKSNEYERVQTKLAHITKQAVGATDEQVNALLRQADTLQQLGVVSKEAIVSAQAQFATFDLQTESIQRLIPSFLDLVVAEKGVNASTYDMIGYANALGAALQGNYAALTQRGFILDEDTKNLIKNGNEAEKITAITKVLDSTYKGLNESMRNTSEGGAMSFNMALNDIKKSGGEVITDIITPFTIALRDLFIWLNNTSPALTGMAVAGGALTSVLITLHVTGLTRTLRSLMTWGPHMVKATGSTWLFTGSLGTAAAAVRTFFASLGPIGLAIMGITTLVTAFGIFKLAVGGANDEMSENEKQLRTQQERTRLLTSTVRDANNSLEDRKRALREIQEIHPDYLKGIDLEIISQEELKNATENSIAALEKQIRLKVLDENLNAAIRQKIKAEERIKKPKPGLGDYLQGFVLNKPAQLSLESAAADYEDAIEEINRLQAQIDDINKKALEEIPEQSKTTIGYIKEKLKKDIEEYRQQYDNLEAADKEGKQRIEKLIRENEAKLKELTVSGKGAALDKEKKALFDKNRSELTEQQRHAEKMIGLETDNELIVLSAKIKHFDEMIELYKKYGEDVSALVHKRIEAELELEKKREIKIDLDEEQPEDLDLKFIYDLEEYKKNIRIQSREEELRHWYETETERLGQYYDNIEAQRALDEEYALRKAELDREIAFEQMQNQADVLNFIASAGNKYTAMAKLAAIFDALLKAKQAFMTALAAFPPPINYAFAAAVAVVAAKQVKDIAAMQPPKFEGFEKGGRLPEGKAGFVEGYHDEIIAPEKTFIEIFKHELRPQIYGNMNSSSGSGFEINEVLMELKTVLKDGINAQAFLDDETAYQIYLKGRAMYRRGKI